MRICFPGGFYTRIYFCVNALTRRFTVSSYNVSKTCLLLTQYILIPMYVSYYIYVCIYYVCIYIYDIMIINYFARMFRSLFLALRPTCQVHLPEKAIFSHPPRPTNDFLSFLPPRRRASHSVNVRSFSCASKSPFFVFMLAT